MRAAIRLVIYASAAWLVTSCGDSSTSAPPDATGHVDASQPRADTGTSPAEQDAAGMDARTAPDPADGGVVERDASGVPPDIEGISCSSSPPMGAESPAPLPTYAGTCPAITNGVNEIQTAGETRRFVVMAPPDSSPDEPLPVLFFWHWLAGDAQSVAETTMLEAAVSSRRFIAVIPEAKGDLRQTWPFTPIDSQGRIDEELGFFDDMLACVAEQLPVNRQCVSTAGVSAGALFAGVLAARRSTVLSSFISLSGGTGGFGVRPWAGAEHPLPAIVAWGGPTDTCVVNFDTASRNLMSALTSDGHFLVECVHNCGHSVPPGDGQSIFDATFDFFLRHPYWLSAGQSPYQAEGLPALAPSWCGVGAGSAVPREGRCDPSDCQ